VNVSGALPIRSDRFSLRRTTAFHVMIVAITTAARVRPVDAADRQRHADQRRDQAELVVDEPVIATRAGLLAA
jgi:hypothetical protein